jgi:hypothetical protein
MNAIDRPGTFRGNITEAGVSETKNGFPQFTARFKATEFYDESTGEWTAWSEYEQEIVGYHVLYTKDKKDGSWVELLNAQQIKKALGWTGESFTDLATTDYSQTLVMFRVETSEFNGNTMLKVTWLDAADANPTRQLQKYDASKLTAMDGAFKGILANKKPTPASAKPASATPAAGKPVTPPKKPGRPAGGKNSPPSGAPAKASTPPAAPAPTAAGAPKPECTKDEAWEEAVTNPVRDKDITDEKLGEVWLAEAAKIGKDEDKFSPADWATVRDAVVKETSKF